jgi:hypothetical protein
VTDNFTDRELEGYYRKEPKATEKAILAFLRDSRNPHMIVYGVRAINAHLPAWLDKETGDWDIYTKADPKLLAGKLEGKLDKRYGGDFFRVEPAVHAGTFRVRSKVTGSVVADVSLKDRTVGFVRMAGINYASLKWLEEDAKRVLANPDAKFRHAKDRDTLQRIHVLKQVKRKRASRGEQFIDGSSVLGVMG